MNPLKTIARACDIDTPPGLVRQFVRDRIPFMSCGEITGLLLTSGFDLALQKFVEEAARHAVADHRSTIQVQHVARAIADKCSEVRPLMGEAQIFVEGAANLPLERRQRFNSHLYSERSRKNMLKVEREFKTRREQYLDDMEQLVSDITVHDARLDALLPLEGEEQWLQALLQAEEEGEEGEGEGEGEAEEEEQAPEEEEEQEEEEAPEEEEDVPAPRQSSKKRMSKKKKAKSLLRRSKANAMSSQADEEEGEGEDDRSNEDSVASRTRTRKRRRDSETPSSQKEPKSRKRTKH